MTVFHDLALGFTSRMKVADVGEHAAWGEENGVGEMWTTESAAFRTSFSILTLVAARTKKMKLGLGTTGVYARHPAIIAAEIATLDEFSAKRLTVGLGIDPTPRIDSDGSMRSMLPIAAIREAMEIIRGTMDGTIRGYDGKVFKMNNPELNFEFEPIRKKVPLYLGAKSPQMLHLAGGMSDGLVMTLLTTPRYVRYAWKELEAGAKMAGKGLGDDFGLVAYLLFSVAKDRKAAREATKQFLGTYLAHVRYGPAQKEAGVSEEEIRPFKEAHDHHDHSGLAKLVTDEHIDKFATAGTPADCAETIMEYVEAGVRTPVAFYPFGPNPREAIKLIGREVLPLVRKKARR
ncbi:MAG: LLM class flavin-dependent oxidoreductase [Thaumarchaeota archaeon]|nr:LLM class flavin-dependent oxidoreductase [Nitrososphaerota archaeon]